MIDVYLTIDTECSMGAAFDVDSNRPVGPERAVLGQNGDRPLGISLMMDILEHHGLRGVFFTEVLAAPVVGEAVLGRAYADIIRRGHDAQLHLHPVFHFYRSVTEGWISQHELPPHMDQIGALPLGTQRRLLESGVSIFEKIHGRSPIAFRAGNYGATLETLKILGELGFSYDSSFNAAQLGRKCLIDARGVTNSPWQEGAVWEIPLTVCQTGVGRLAGLKPLDIGAVSFIEIKRALQQAGELGMTSVTMILHSFSLLKKADIQFRRIRADRLVIRRFKRVCRYLAEHRDRFRVVTFADRPVPRPYPYATPPPDLGYIVPSARRIIQGLNRPYWFTISATIASAAP